MKLYLLRHGKAENVSATGLDRDRELTSEGVEEMREEAATLARLGLKLDLILTSPYPRASKTAEIVAEALKLEPEIEKDDRLACGFGFGDLQSIAEGLVGIERLMLVGHNPDFSMIAGELCGGAALDLKKGGLARLEVYRMEPGGALLEWVLTPSILRLQP
jgi:phosphohistidine phosphatase